MKLSVLAEMCGMIVLMAMGMKNMPSAVAMNISSLLVGLSGFMGRKLSLPHMVRRSHEMVRHAKIYLLKRLPIVTGAMVFVSTMSKAVHPMR